MSDDAGYPPYTFADTAGKRWSLKMNFSKKNKLKTQAGFDVSAVVKSGLSPLAELASDPERMGQIVFLLVEDQLAATTADEFLSAFDGETVKAAYLAFAEAVFDFFQNPRLAELFREATQIGNEVGAKEVPMLREKINVENEARTLIDSALNSRAS